MFRTRKSLQEHREECSNDFGRVHGLLRESTLRMSPLSDFEPGHKSKEELRMERRKKLRELRQSRKKGRRRNKHHLCCMCEREFPTSAMKRGH